MVHMWRRPRLDQVAKRMRRASIVCAMARRVRRRSHAISCASALGDRPSQCRDVHRASSQVGSDPGGVVHVSNGFAIRPLRREEVQEDRMIFHYEERVRPDCIIGKSKDLSEEFG